MAYAFEVFRVQYYVAREFVRHLVHARATSAAVMKLGVHSRFWSGTADAHLKQGALYWCMAFGSHADTNLTHLGKLGRGRDSKAIRASFRLGLLARVEMSASAWRKYHANILNFRNKYVAHRELGEYMEPTPVWDKALEAAYFYDEWVRDLIAPDLIDSPSFGEQGAALRSESEPLIEAAIRASMTAARDAPLSMLGRGP